MHARALAALLVIAACSGTPSSNVPDAGADAHVTPPSPDAEVRGLVDFGAIADCPRQMLIADGYLYWLLDRVDQRELLRSPVDHYAPESLYRTSEAMHDVQVVPGGLVWSTGSWPARLDLGTRQVAPLVREAADGLAVVGGQRVFVSRSVTQPLGEQIAEVVDGALLPYVTAPYDDYLSDLRAGPSMLYWIQGGSRRCKDVFGGIETICAGADPVAAAHADRDALWVIATSGRSAKLERWASSAQPLADVPGTATTFAIAGGDGGPLYVLADQAMYRALPPAYTPVRLDEVPLADAIASDGTTTFVATCTKLQRYLP